LGFKPKNWAFIPSISFIPVKPSLLKAICLAVHLSPQQLTRNMQANRTHHLNAHFTDQFTQLSHNTFGIGTYSSREQPHPQHLTSSYQSTASV